MEFIKKLKRSKENKEMFIPIKAKNYRLSIQASSFHYSIPKKYLEKEKYRCFELAIFNQNGWFDISKSSKIKKFSNYKTLMKYSDGEYTGTQVFCYVPVQLVEKLYQFLIKTS